MDTISLGFGALAIAMVLVGCSSGDTKTSGNSPVAPTSAKPIKSTQGPKAAANSWPKEKATAFLSGSIKLDGKAPRTQPAPLNPECKALHGEKQLMLEYAVVGEKGELANAVVFVSKMPEAYTFETPSEKKLIDQVGCHYVPHVLAVMVDQDITIRNSDPINHNINAGEGFFNIVQSQKGQEDVRHFEKPILGKPIQCDVHKWMKTYACVFDHPLYAVSGADGKYTFTEKLVPGKYTLSVWHENDDFKAAKATEEIEVQDGESKTQDFTFKQE